MTINESIALTPHMGDRLRDAYWSNEWPKLTPLKALGLFVFVMVAGFSAAALV